MITYPKIETLFIRDKDTFKVTDTIRLPEFEVISNWLITEKIDGTNIRVIYQPNEEGKELSFAGKTNTAQIPPFLLITLQDMFSISKFESFSDNTKEPLNTMILFGEGYGARIQKGGGAYNSGNSFRLFDVWIDGWWLEWDKVCEVANIMGIETVPVAGLMNIKDALTFVEPRDKQLADARLYSRVALNENNNSNKLAEGIVARAYPTLLFRNGTPVKWKLKYKDLEKELNYDKS